MEENTTFIGPMTDTLINSFVKEMKKNKNKKKIMKNIVEPILNDINDRYYLHMITLIVLLIVIIILLSLLLIIGAINLKNTNLGIGNCNTTGENNLCDD
jgi:hypothetical protein